MANIILLGPPGAGKSLMASCLPGILPPLTPQEALDGLARDQDRMMERLQRSNAQATCAPKLNPERDAQYWYDQPGAPKPKLRPKLCDVRSKTCEISTAKPKCAPWN